MSTGLIFLKTLSDISLIFSKEIGGTTAAGVSLSLTSSIVTAVGVSLSLTSSIVTAVGVLLSLTSSIVTASRNSLSLPKLK